MIYKVESFSIVALKMLGSPLINVPCQFTDPILANGEPEEIKKKKKKTYLAYTFEPVNYFGRWKV